MKSLLAGLLVVVGVRRVLELLVLILEILIFFGIIIFS